jgi:glutamate 5-kinase
MKFDKIKKIVIKIGSSSISSLDKGLNRTNLKNLVTGINLLISEGKQVILVSSGAISLGLFIDGKKRKPSKLSKLQYAASIGQIELMQAYKKTFQSLNKNINIAQILLTSDDLIARERYLNAKNTIQELIDHKALPIVNENDTVSYKEIQFGDNDLLAATVSNLIEADLLVIFTDQKGLYDADPTKNKNAKLIAEISIDDQRLSVLASSKQSSSGIGSGGIRSKIIAAETASRGGAATVIAKGVSKSFFQSFSDDQIEGTLINPGAAKIKAKQKWMIDNSKSRGILTLDAGAVIALKNHKKSLLPVGVLKLEGNFVRGDLLKCIDVDGKEVARGLSNFSSEDAKKIIGKRLAGQNFELENKIDDNLIHRDNMVIIK